MIPRLTPQDSLKQPFIAFLSALERAGFSGDIDASYSSRLAVATDNSVYQWMPQAVLHPKTTADIALMLKLASAPEYRQVTFSPRGGGTGTNGQSLTDGIMVDVSRYMTSVLALEVADRKVRVQAGLVKDKLNVVLKPHNLFFSPELSTSNRATIGGMVNTDASGQGSVKYGKTSDHVLGVQAVLMDGSIIEAKPVQGAELEEKLAQTDLEGDIYRLIMAIAKDNRSDIEATFPKLNRFLTGYDLVHVYDPVTETIDLSRLLCGSEGTLAFITEILLDLTPIPTYRALVNIKYDSFESALRNAPLMMDADALSVETVDSRVLNLAREDIIWHSVKGLIQDVPGKDMQGLNIVEFAGANESEQQPKLQALCEKLDAFLAEGKAGIIGYQVCTELSGIESIYGMRKKAVGLLGNAPGSRKPVAFTEDTAVPPEKLADFIMEFRALLDSHNLMYGMFGHVDDAWFNFGVKNDWSVKVGHFEAYDLSPAGQDTYVVSYDDKIYRAKDGRGRNNNGGQIMFAKESGQWHMELAAQYGDYASTSYLAEYGTDPDTGALTGVTKNKDPLLVRPVVAWTGDTVTVAVGAEINAISDAYVSNDADRISAADWTGYGAAVSAKVNDDTSVSLRAAYRNGDEIDQYSVGPGIQYQNFYAAYLFGKTKYSAEMETDDVKYNVVYASYKIPAVMGIDNFDMYLGTSWGNEKVGDADATEELGGRVRFKYYF